MVMVVKLVESVCVVYQPCNVVWILKGGLLHETAVEREVLVVALFIRFKDDGYGLTSA